MPTAPDYCATSGQARREQAHQGTDVVLAWCAVCQVSTAWSETSLEARLSFHHEDNTCPVLSGLHHNPEREQKHAQPSTAPCCPDLQFMYMGEHDRRDRKTSPGHGAYKKLLHVILIAVGPSTETTWVCILFAFASLGPCNVYFPPCSFLGCQEGTCNLLSSSCRWLQIVVPFPLKYLTPHRQSVIMLVRAWSYSWWYKSGADSISRERGWDWQVSAY